MTETERNEITQRFSAAMSARDIIPLSAVLADGVIRSLPGKSLMSGEKHGVEAILKRIDTFIADLDMLNAFFV